MYAKFGFGWFCLLVLQKLFCMGQRHSTETIIVHLISEEWECGARSLWSSEINQKITHHWAMWIHTQRIYVTHSVKMRLFCAHGQNWVISKIYILPFIMIVKILKSYNPKGSYAHLTIGGLKSMKWKNQLSKSAIYHWVNGQLGKKSWKLHHLWSKSLAVW